MSFLVEGLIVIGQVAAGYSALKVLAGDLKNVLTIADEGANVALDITQQLIEAIGQENNLSKEELDKIDFTPDYEYQYSTWEKVGFKALQGLTKYGNYCAPGWTSGEWFSGNTPEKYKAVKPIDELDNACRTHDWQYNLNKVPRYQTLADIELVTKAEKILTDNPNISNKDYIRDLISVFKKKIFIDLVKNGNVPNIKLPMPDEVLGTQTPTQQPPQNKSINNPLVIT